MTERPASAGVVDVVGRIDEIPHGTMQARTLSNGDKVCVVHTDAGICVLADRCTHREFPLSQGDVTPGGLVECAWHGAQFDPVTGMMLAGPGGDDVATYEVEITGDVITVSLQPRLR